MGATPTFNPNPNIAFETRDPKTHPQRGDVFQVRDSRPGRGAIFVVYAVGMGAGGVVAGDTIEVAAIGAEMRAKAEWFDPGTTDRSGEPIGVNFVRPIRMVRRDRLKRCDYLRSWTRRETMQSVAEKVLSDANDSGGEIGTSDRANGMDVETLREITREQETSAIEQDPRKDAGHGRLLNVRGPEWMPKAGDVFRVKTPTGALASLCVRVVTPTGDRKSARCLPCSDRGYNVSQAETTFSVEELRTATYLGNTRLGNVGLAP